MNEIISQYYEKRGQVLVKNLKARHFDAHYCATSEEALQTALSLIPQGASVGWGGCMSCEQIGLVEAVRKGDYKVIDREAVPLADRERVMKQCLTADVFLTGANGISIDGQMVNIDGNANRVGAICYGPDKVIVVAGMNKVCDNLDSAINRARTVAAPANMQRFNRQTPCGVNAVCADCRSEACICNQILITRNCRPAGRITFVLVGQDLGL